MRKRFQNTIINTIFALNICILFLCNSLFAEYDDLVLERRPSAHEIGDKKMFWTWDLTVMPPKNIKLQSTCHGIGENVYVFVSDDVWNNNIFPEDIEKIIRTFDSKTPETSVDNNKGIYQVVTETFGLPPDVDNDPRIYFLIYQLGMYHGHHFDGYIRPIDEMFGKYSNHSEIMYLDCDNPCDDYHLAVIAHEFQHLIHWRYDKNESSWLNESLSEVAMILCGYFTDKNHVVRYLNNTNRPLVSKGHLVSYGACLLWGTYMYDQFGLAFLKNLVLEDENGIDGLENTLTNTNIKDGFSNIFGDWLVANYLNTDLADNEKYKYKSITLPTYPTVKHFFTLPVRDAGKVFGYGVNYLKFSVGKKAKSGKLRITFKSNMFGDFLIGVIKIDNDDLPNSEIKNVTLNEHNSVFDVDNVGTNYREIVLAISVLKTTKEPVPYSYSATLIPYTEGGKESQ